MKVNISKAKLTKFAKQIVQKKNRRVIKTDELLLEQVSKFKYVGVSMTEGITKKLR